ncbi:MAG: hypothetical protein U1U88_001656 [Lawsonella clevelandensis]
MDESALLASSWEPREHIDFADLSADDERNADATFVTEADFAEADRLMGEDLDGSDVGTDDANDIEDVEAEADALAAYAEAEAVDAVDEFPGETQVEDVPAADEWITPTTAEFDIVPEAGEEAATLAAVDDDEPEEADEDVATEDFTSEDLAEEGLTEEDLIDDTEDDALLDEPLDGPDMARTTTRFRSHHTLKGKTPNSTLMPSAPLSTPAPSTSSTTSLWLTPPLPTKQKSLPSARPRL